MSQDLRPDQELTVALASAVLDGIENSADEHADARLADELSLTVGSYANRLMREDRERFAEQISIFSAFLAACRAHDQAHATGNVEQAQKHLAEIDKLRRKCKEATKYIGLTEAAEALVKAKDFGEFCALLPLVPLDRLYGRDFGRFSPFPLIWALSARAQPLERVRLMLSAGARVDLTTGLGNTVLHAMAQMRRKSRARLDILMLLVSEGADLHAKNINGQTPLAVALTDGSVEDVGCFLAAGAPVDIPELQYAAETPERLRLVLEHIAGVHDTLNALIELQHLLPNLLAQAQEHARDAKRSRLGTKGYEDRVKDLGKSLEMVNAILNGAKHPGGDARDSPEN